MAESVLVSRTIWLVRHGESTWNRLGLCQGHNDESELTGRGQEHAREVAASLRERTVSAIYVSDLRRAVQTATRLVTGLDLPLHRDVRLRERCFGSREGGPLSELGPDVTGIRDGVVTDPDAEPAGGESLRAFYARVASFGADLASRDESGALPPGEVVIVAHGGTVRMLHACLGGPPVERMSWMPVPNGTILRAAIGATGDRRDPARRDYA